MRRIINAILYRWGTNRPCRVVNVGGAPYLERYHVATVFGWSIMLHRFVSPDPEPDMHNHPWGFGISIILTGGYIEERFRFFAGVHSAKHVTVARRVRRVSWVGGDVFHRILGADPCTWTLFIHSPRTQYTKRNGERAAKGFGSLSGGVYTPYPMPTTAHWELTAPLGRYAGRAPLTPIATHKKART